MGPCAGAGARPGRPSRPCMVARGCAGPHPGRRPRPADAVEPQRAAVPPSLGRAPHRQQGAPHAPDGRFQPPLLQLRVAPHLPQRGRGRGALPPSGRQAGRTSGRARLAVRPAGRRPRGMGLAGLAPDLLLVEPLADLGLRDRLRARLVPARAGPRRPAGRAAGRLRGGHRSLSRGAVGAGDHRRAVLLLRGDRRLALGRVPAALRARAAGGGPGLRRRRRLGEILPRAPFAR
jgi:hypothetical protein